MKKNKETKSVSPYLLVLLSFVGVILFGSVLLTLPFAHQNGQWGNYLDSIFISTSATCVTGLCTYEAGLGGELTLFGQIVTLVMIQIGGLGFITIFAFFVSIFSRKLKFKDRLFLSQAVNSNTVAQVSKYVVRVITIVIIIESLGFIFGLPIFLNPEYLEATGLSIPEALWMNLFNSISAFNNAGFDLFGNTSLIRGVGNIYMDSMPEWAYYYFLSYIMLLIILGGISFVVIIEIFFNRKKPKQWSAFTKIVLLTTAILLAFGTLAFFLSDGLNGNITVFQAFFQSVTTRTAGFACFDQDSLSVAGKTISAILMFIGGSPIGTAGGIKTTTIFIIALSFIRFVQGKQIVAFQRQYTRLSIIKAMSLVFLAIVIVFITFTIITSLEVNNPHVSSENLFFEVFSAFGTVGLSANVTTTLSFGSKIVICILMFFGRLGPITMFQIFQQNMDKEESKHFKYIEADVIIG